MNSMRSRLEKRLHRLRATTRSLRLASRRAPRIDLVYLPAEEHQRLQSLLG